VDRILLGKIVRPDPAELPAGFPERKSNPETTGEIMRKYAISLLPAIISVMLPAAFAEGNAVEASLEQAEYELMSLFVNDEYGKEFSLILISSETESWCLGGDLGILRKTWPELRNGTIDALIVNNRGGRCGVEERFSLLVEYRLLSDRDYAGVLRPGGTIEAGIAAAGAPMPLHAGADAAPDWDNFDRVFPDAQGYLTFSRAGFDAERTQALVIFSNAYRCSGTSMMPDSRKIAFFRNRGSGWELVGVSCGIDVMGR
jgi:hypothetical protein